MMIDIRKAIEQLQSRRKLFVSEADFQLELAWTLKQMYPNAFVRCEYVPVFEKDMHIDILVILDGTWIPIELKYKTRECEKQIGDEYYFLKKQGANSVNRYLYLKDIERIERVRKNKKDIFGEGYAIFITNDLSYTKKATQKNCVYEEFSIHTGANKTGEMKWAEHTGAGTKKGNEAPIKLEGNYECKWEPYSIVDTSNNGRFMYLINEIRAEESL